jgi:hypothetical protein
MCLHFPFGTAVMADGVVIARLPPSTAALMGLSSFGLWRIIGSTYIIGFRRLVPSVLSAFRVIYYAPAACHPMKEEDTINL